ncbi:hypothetical protein ILYODFUR_033091 [Ilyodon furcidens]|uniref:Uncharacterized protein n=1 Tax=Ilyodon furcidens TaxID=33524 RepID=A0ABV0U0W4_9TELE
MEKRLRERKHRGSEGLRLSARPNHVMATPEYGFNLAQSLALNPQRGLMMMGSVIRMKKDTISDPVTLTAHTNTAVLCYCAIVLWYSTGVYYRSTVVPWCSSSSAVEEPSSSFSGRLRRPQCRKERHRRSFIPTAVRLFSSTV